MIVDLKPSRVVYIFFLSLGMHLFFTELHSS